MAREAAARPDDTADAASASGGASRRPRIPSGRRGRALPQAAPPRVPSTAVVTTERERVGERDDEDGSDLPGSGAPPSARRPKRRRSATLVRTTAAEPLPVEVPAHERGNLPQQEPCGHGQGTRAGGSANSIGTNTILRRHGRAVADLELDLCRDRVSPTSAASSSSDGSAAGGAAAASPATAAPNAQTLAHFTSRSRPCSRWRRRARDCSRRASAAGSSAIQAASLMVGGEVVYQSPIGGHRPADRAQPPVLTRS